MRDDVTHSTPAARTGAPAVTEHEFPGRDDDTIRVRAALLGFTTSERDAHGHDEYHRNGADVSATLRWAERRRADLHERFETRQLGEAERDRALATLDIYEKLLNRPDVPPLRKPWYQIEPGSCSRCRWFEARILRVEAELVDSCTCPYSANVAESELGARHWDRLLAGKLTADERVSAEMIRVLHDDDCGSEEPSARYLVLTYGRSRVPGETDKRRAAWTNSGFEVVEFLVQRDRGRSRAPFLPAASARVLAQAAEWDDDIREAFVNRAVA
jgi:hypothetical protein